MFFRREKPKTHTFATRTADASSAGFEIKSVGNSTRAIRKGVAAELHDAGEGKVRIGHTGMVVGNEIGQLTDLGYQKIFLTPSGKRIAAQAEHLKLIHAFVEDLREALGSTSLYNEGLGTTNDLHLYDRVEGRDRGHAAPPWTK
ncbi:MAG: hypothetical protein FJW39_14375 [Acidobacteria bacterium]|nr:hypothetical protein [Acidobacteriota bacterium]